MDSNNYYDKSNNSDVNNSDGVPSKELHYDPSNYRRNFYREQNTPTEAQSTAHQEELYRKLTNSKYSQSNRDNMQALQQRNKEVYYQEERLHQNRNVDFYERNRERETSNMSTAQRSQVHKQREEQNRNQSNKKRKKSSLAQQNSNAGLYVLIFLLLFFGVIGFCTGNFSAKNRQEQKYTALIEEMEIELDEALSTITTLESSEVESEVTTDETEETEWYLRLVNRENLMDEDEVVELAEVAWGYEVDARIVDELEAMMEAASEDGVEMIICSAYRTWEYQEELFNTSMANYIANGYTYYEAYNLAGDYTALPGGSEHQLGLALDFVSADYQLLDEEQANTDVAQWLEENSYNYGFVLRYPEDKEDITGILYESWHFRYVGVEAATIMYEERLVLEEYLEIY